MNFRRLRMGLATILGLSPRGFFIPYRYASQISPSDRRVYHHIAASFGAATPDFAAILDIVDSYRAGLLAITAEGEPPHPRWGQDWFPALDAAVLYALVRHHRPARIVEVGSGHSTRFIARALADEAFDAAVTAIDPAPRATITDLPIDVICEPIQCVDPAAIGPLEAGDFLIVDSSHILMPGSDVDIVVNDILPRLPAGVFVHIHDIFLPDPYPQHWAWRGYNEQVAIAAIVDGGRSYAPVFASHYARQVLGQRLAASVINELPSPTGAFDSSLWLKKN